MKYFRAVNIDDATDVLYISSKNDLEGEQVVAERTHTGNYGYTFRVMPKHEMLLDSANLNLVKWITK